MRHEDQKLILLLSKAQFNLLGLASCTWWEPTWILLLGANISRQTRQQLLKRTERRGEFQRGQTLPVSFEMIPCSWKHSYEPPPTNLHRWQWRVTVTQKQVANKQRLENASPSLCLSSGNPLFHTPLHHTGRTHTAALYSSTVIVSAMTQTFPDAATTSLVSDTDLIHRSLMQGAEVYKEQLQK